MTRRFNDADRRAIELAVFDRPLDADALAQIATLSSIGQAALLLAADENAIEAWYRATPDPTGAISRVLFRAVDNDDVADRIDATLLEDPTVLADLCRAQITWHHEDLPTLLDRPESRQHAAWMLAQTDFQPVIDWLSRGQRQEAEAVVDVARGAAVSGVEALFDPVADWYEAIRAEDAALGARLEAALFVLAPRRWGRGYVSGLYEADFLADDVAMADIISAAGQSYWTGALAAFEPASEEFAAIARMVAAGAAAALHFSVDAPPPEVVDAFYREDWATLSRHPAFTVATALAEEEDWFQPLLEAAAHDLLRAHALESPGIGGLPLSSSQPDADEVAAAQSMLELEDLDAVALIATTLDVQELGRLPGYESLPQHFSALDRHDHYAVARVARALNAPPHLDDELPLMLSDGLAGLAAAERVAQRGSVEALDMLTEAWGRGPALRAPTYSALLHQELRAIASLTADPSES